MSDAPSVQQGGDFMMQQLDLTIMMSHGLPTTASCYFDLLF